MPLTARIRRLNGKAQPIFPLQGDDPEHTPMTSSDIVRYGLSMLRIDYDTDGDGKPDLPQDLVQVPKLLSRDYKAANF